MKDLIEFLKASDFEKEQVYSRAASLLKANEEHIEKDFWVSFALDVIFNDAKNDQPRILFKGGTSLSKVFNLIDRFSEDIDLTVFKEDIGFNHSTEDLVQMTNKPKKHLLEKMTQKCSDYIQGDFKESLSEAINKRLSLAGIKDNMWTLKEDDTDPDKQSLSFLYPSVYKENDPYVKKAVKLEAGAKSALNPHIVGELRPYISNILPNLNLKVGNVTTILPSRTLWDKFMILHSLNQRSLSGWTPKDGHRNSRHYYDVFQLMKNEESIKALYDFKLSEDVRNHTQQYFNRGPANLDQANHETITLSPNNNLKQSLADDYAAMRVMIFGNQPKFDDILAVVERTEGLLHKISKTKALDKKSMDRGIEIDI